MESCFLRISRAVHGDVEFIDRVRVACSLANSEYSEDLAIFVANHCVEGIEVDENLTVSTRGVSDADISAGIAAYWEKNGASEENEDA